MLSAPALQITYKSFLEDLSLRQFLKGNTPLSIVTWCNKSKWLVVDPQAAQTLCVRWNF